MRTKILCAIFLGLCVMEWLALGMSVVVAKNKLNNDYRFGEKIKALGREPAIITIHLGVAVPEPNQAVDEVVSLGNAALPDLRKALHGRDPIIAGRAARCLWELKCFDADKEAKRGLAFFRAQNKIPDTGFAIASLEWYLRFVPNPDEKQ